MHLRRYIYVISLGAAHKANIPSFECRDLIWDVLLKIINSIMITVIQLLNMRYEGRRLLGSLHVM